MSKIHDQIALLSTVHDQLDEGLCLVDSGCRVRHANRTFASLLNVPLDAVIGRDLSDLWHQLEGDRPIPASGAALRRAVAERTALTEVGTVVQSAHAVESPTPLVLSTTPLSTGGDLSVVLLRDITTMTQIVHALQQSRARFDAVFHAETGILLIALDGTIMRTNPAWEAMIGRADSALYGTRFLDSVVAADRPQVAALLNSLGDNVRGHARRTVEARFSRPDAEPIWVSLVVSLIRDAQGAPRHALAVLEDVTARHAAEAELREVKRRLARSREQERLRLAQELHDGPMQDLYAAQFLLQKLRLHIDESIRTLAETIQATVTQVNNTLRAVASELRPPTLAPFGLEVAVRAHVEKFNERYPALNVNLAISRDGQALPEHMRLALYRIVQEALSNVARHARASTVDIEFTLSEATAALEIRDDGRGFTVPRRWVALARQNHFGLIGVAERVEDLDGHFAIESAPGEGTRIRVSVPRRAADSEEDR